MRIKAKNDTYTVPPIGLWVVADFNEGNVERMTAGTTIRVQFIEWEKMLEIKSSHKEEIGIPTMIAHEGAAIVLYPSPREDGELHLSFYPPMQML